MSICAIINPCAGSIAHRVDAVCERMRGCGCEVLTTRARGDAQMIARAAVEQGAERIIAVGGDGTISEVINGIAPMGAAVTLAIIPGGTGNDLVRCLDLPVDDDEEAMVALAVSGEGRALDVVEVKQPTAHWFVNVASVGFGGEIASAVRDEDKSRFGASAYWMAAAAHMTQLQRHRVRLTVDEMEMEMFIFGVQMANGRFVGGGFPIAPMAMLDDGLLDLIVIPADSPAELIARGFERIVAWTQGSDGPFPTRGKRVRMEFDPAVNVWSDGEPRGSGNIELCVHEHRLRIVTGPDPRGFSQG